VRSAENHPTQFLQRQTAKRVCFFMISLHTQLLIGLVLYFFLSPITTGALSDFGAAMKDPATRLLAVEHISVNIIAVVLATINNAENKKAIADAA
jgi:hypothetical protein